MTLVITEIGVNHQGSDAEAMRLIDAAIDAGANVAKFQLFSETYADGKYEHLRLSRESIKRMEKYCKGKIGFACTAFSVDDLSWLLSNTQMEFVKIGSGQYYDVPLSLEAARSQLPMIISAKDGVELPSKKDHEYPYLNISYLHVVPEYPTSPEKANLKRIKEWWCSGISDHSGEIFVPLAAVALGAKIVECHITMDKDQEGPDHKASLTPDQFREMVKGIRILEKAL